MQTIINIVTHPYDSVSIVNWMLDCWDVDPHLSLMVLCAKGEGKAIENRIRVKLASARSAVRKEGAQLSQEFGLSVQHISWTELNNSEYDAICLSRFVTLRQRLRGAFKDLIQADNQVTISEITDD